MKECCRLIGFKISLQHFICAIYQCFITLIRSMTAAISSFASDYLIDGVYYDFDANGLAEAVSYTISYVMNGGKNSSANPAEYTGLSDTITFAEPSRSGYTFEGWYSDVELTVAVKQIEEKSFGDVIIYAKWEMIPADDDDDDDGSYGSSSSGSDSSSDITESNTVSAGAGTTSAGAAAVTATGPAQVTGPAAAAAEQAAQENSSNAQAVRTAAVNESVAIQVAGNAVSAIVSQTTTGSVSGNTIATAAANTTVAVSEVQIASVVTTAIAADGSARSLLASAAQGTTVQQTTVTAQEVTAAQNVVVYADGAQVSQQSGATELSGFAAAVADAEAAIHTGVRTVVQTYNDKVAIDLNQYSQVGSAVTYAVIAGTDGNTAKTQMEQTSFAVGGGADYRC